MKHFFVRFFFLKLFLLVGGMLTPTFAQTHRVQQGETLYSIARLYQMNADDLSSINGNITSIRLGQALKVRRGNTAAAGANPNRMVSGATRTHRVLEGETLYSIARRYGMDVETLKAMNGIEHGIRVGYMLKVKPMNGQVPSAGNRAATRHVVRQGETMYSIAQMYGLTVEQLIARNPNLQYGKALSAGQDLALPANARSQARSHTVQQGETVSSIARRYGVSMEAVRNANPNLNQLARQQTIRVPGVEQGSSMKNALRNAHHSGKVSTHSLGLSGLSIAHETLPIGTIVLLSNQTTNKHTFARVTQRKPADNTVAALSSELTTLLNASAASTIEIRLQRNRR